MSMMQQVAQDKSANDRQYGTSSKLAARARLNELYSRDQEPWFAFVARNAAISAGERVLDIGCGPGWFWANVHAGMPGGIDLTLSDLSTGMVEEAVARVGGLGKDWTVRGKVADAAALPFPDAGFDAVIAMHMLYHVPDASAAVAEAARVLKPGGRYIVTTNDRDNLRALYELGAKAFGVGDGGDPAGAIFGFAEAETMLRKTFGNVEKRRNPGRLQITDPDHIFEAQTSFPPGDGASDDQLSRLRSAIADAFETGGGTLVAEKQIAAFISRKAD